MFDLYTAVILMTLFFLIITIADVMTNRLITEGTKIKSVITCLLIAVAALGEIYFSEGKTESAREHQPEYLRVSQAERERAEREAGKHGAD